MKMIVPWKHKKGNVKPLTRKSIFAQCISSAMVGPRTWIRGIFSSLKHSGSNKYIDFKFTPLQEARYQRIRERMNVPFDENRIEHQVYFSAPIPIHFLLS